MTIKVSNKVIDRLNSIIDNSRNSSTVIYDSIYLNEYHIQVFIYLVSDSGIITY